MCVFSLNNHSSADFVRALLLFAMKISPAMLIMCLEQYNKYESSMNERGKKQKSMRYACATWRPNTPNTQPLYFNVLIVFNSFMAVGRPQNTQKTLQLSVFPTIFLSRWLAVHNGTYANTTLSHAAPHHPKPFCNNPVHILILMHNALVLSYNITQHIYCWIVYCCIHFISLLSKCAYIHIQCTIPYYNNSM